MVMITSLFGHRQVADVSNLPYVVIDGHDYVTIWSSTGRRCVKLALCGQVKMQTRFGPRVVTAFPRVTSVGRRGLTW